MNGPGRTTADAAVDLLTRAFFDTAGQAGHRGRGTERDIPYKK